MKSPAFQFYVRDWLCSLTVQRMTGDQVKAYMYLLCASWLEHPRATLPNNDDDLAMLSRMSVEQWLTIKDGVLKNFTLIDDRWVSEKLSQISYKQEKRASAGQIGGENARGKSGRKVENSIIFPQQENENFPQTIAKPIANEIAKPIANIIANEIAKPIAKKIHENGKNAIVENFNKNVLDASRDKSSDFPQTIAKPIANEIAKPIAKEYPAFAIAVNSNTNTNNSGVFEEMKIFFGFDSEIKHAKKWFEINAFLNELSEKNEIEHFKHQFEFYKKYKTESGEKAHSFHGFINDGWDAQNWEFKLKSLKKSDEKKSEINIDEIKH